MIKMMARCNGNRCTRWATHVRMINGTPVVFCIDCAWSIDKKVAR